MRRWPVAAFVALAIATVAAFFVTQHLKVTTPILNGFPFPQPSAINPIDGQVCRTRSRTGGVQLVSHRSTFVSFYLQNRSDDVNVYIVASDGMIFNGKGHPRGAGTYARVLGHYARDEKALTLMSALRKMTILPANRLQLSLKGRIKIDADADITVFDPTRVIDKATFENPAQYSEGIPFVLVNGVLVVRDGKIVEGVKPGAGIKAR